LLGGIHPQWQRTNLIHLTTLIAMQWLSMKRINVQRIFSFPEDVESIHRLDLVVLPSDIPSDKLFHLPDLMYSKSIIPPHPSHHSILNNTSITMTQKMICLAFLEVANTIHCILV